MSYTRTSDFWKKEPGYFDTLHMRHIFPSKDKYHFPFLEAPPVQELPEPPLALIPYNIRVRSKDGYNGSGVHFFLDDYRFENIWVKPTNSLSRIQSAGLALTPDFSLYADYPLAAQIWNTYRNRWCGAFWKYNGVTVIPTISWSDKRSYDFCFDGVEVGSPVAVGTIGMTSDSQSIFEDGYSQMIKRLNPRFVICYGKEHPPLKKISPDTPLKYYDTYWKLLKKARKSGEGGDFYSGNLQTHLTE